MSMQPADWRPDPKCSEQGVVPVLEAIRKELLHPTAVTTIIPVVSPNGTYFEVTVSLENIESWEAVQERQANVDELLKDL